jgi:lactate dehydrogenase-like 2-hydroxyacid dehydrogenase
MTSKKDSDLLSLERDVVTTPEDVQALRETRGNTAQNWLEVLQQLFDQMPPEAVEAELARRKTFEGAIPFEL